MLLEVRDEREAIVVGERLLASLERPLRIGDRDIQVALSIGDRSGRRAAPDPERAAARRGPRALSGEALGTRPLRALRFQP